MATIVKVPPDRLGAVLRERAKEAPKVVLHGIRLAAERGRAHLVGETPTYTGQMRNAWQTTQMLRGAAVTNSAPHAGIVERGARPHKVSAAGIAALTRWAELVLGLDPEEARAAAWGIAKKLERQGQKATFFVRDSLETQRGFVKDEVERQLHKHHSKPVEGGR